MARTKRRVRIKRKGQSQREETDQGARMQWTEENVRMLWTVILHSQDVRLDLNLAEVSVAWPGEQRPTVFALEQQLQAFRRDSQAGRRVKLRRGDIDVALAAQAANGQTINAHLPVQAPAPAPVIANGNGPATTAAPAAPRRVSRHACSRRRRPATSHPVTSSAAHGRPYPSGPGHANGMSLVDGNAGWFTPSSSSDDRAKESQVQAAARAHPIPVFAPPFSPRATPRDRPTPRPGATITSMNMDCELMAFRNTTSPHGSACDCQNYHCWTCFQKLMSGRA
ncbi:hypothetical protein BDV28DRAFT_147190 [Aspergillus coremiiformis]|uniref:Uncharacterized protein n=1 Tax=Aspergillus coremiiformis TaxID=138285 RepID=A0A5N6ZAA8_9EURO|nr:hypothetical protein BDV28DRAFT_147190 [Aspergillus coremiiformis]